LHLQQLPQMELLSFSSRIQKTLQPGVHTFNKAKFSR